MAILELLSKKSRTYIDISGLRDKKKLSKYEEFKKTYFNDPSGFVFDCFNWGDDIPAFYQINSLDKMVEHKRIAVRGPRGMGKTATLAWAVWWFCLTRDTENGLNDWKVVTTASSMRQLNEFLWPEIHKWYSILNWDIIGREPLIPNVELLQTTIKLSNGHAFTANSNKPEKIEGTHAKNILYIFDEAKAIPDNVFDSVEGAFASPGDYYCLAFSTPGSPQGRFYDIHKRKQGLTDWHPIHIKLEDVIRSGRIDKKWVQNRVLQWGIGYSLFEQHVLGNFAADDKDSIIPLYYVEKANDRHYDKFNDTDIGRIVPDVIGVDIGFEKDPAVIAYRTNGNEIYKVEKLKRYSKETALMEIVGQVGILLDKYPNCIAVLDIDGVGAGVVHRLRELGYTDRIIGFNNGGSPLIKRDRLGENEFRNNRSAMWWMAREALNPDVGDNVILPIHDNLLEELTTPRRKITSDKKIAVESKDDIKKRLSGRSTDFADSVLMALYGPMIARHSGEMEILNLYDEINLPE